VTKGMPAIFFGHGNPMNAVMKKSLHRRLVGDRTIFAAGRERFSAGW